MSYRIQRENSPLDPFTATNASTTTPKVQFATMAGGVFRVDSLSGATKISWYVVLDRNSPPTPLYDSSGAAVETAIVALRAYPIPDACFGAQCIVPVLDAGTAQLRFNLKG
jgi:hypothetical protein